MASLLNISEAASLALHTMVLLAQKPGRRLSAGKIAAALGGSEAHLTKVLQRLAKAGLVDSLRGPRGGFVLGRGADAICLLEVYESIEGCLKPTVCLLASPVCQHGKCLFGDLLGGVAEQAHQHLSETRLSDLTDTFEEDTADDQNHCED